VEPLEPAWRGMALAEIIRAAREHWPIEPTPVPEGGPEPMICRPGMSIGDTIRAAVQREREAAEEAGAQR